MKHLKSAVIAGITFGATYVSASTAPVLTWPNCYVMAIHNCSVLPKQQCIECGHKYCDKADWKAGDAECANN